MMPSKNDTSSSSEAEYFSASSDIESHHVPSLVQPATSPESHHENIATQEGQSLVLAAQTRVVPRQQSQGSAHGSTSEIVEGGSSSSLHTTMTVRSGVAEEVGSLVPAPTGPRALDIEARGSNPANNPTRRLVENPELRRAFLRQVYVVNGAHLFVASCIAIAVAQVPRLQRFFFKSGGGIAFSVILALFTFGLLWPMRKYRRTYPANWALLAVFTALVGFEAGVICIVPKGRLLILVAIFKIVSSVGLYAYTFYAARRGFEFNFFRPFVFITFSMIISYIILQFTLPFGDLEDTLYTLLISVVTSSVGILARRNLANSYEYEDFLWAAIGQYIDIFTAYAGNIVDCGTP